MKIGIISDTHGYLDNGILKHLKNCDEIWHAGDFGNSVVEKLEPLAKLRGVYGNIDGGDLRKDFPEELNFECEGMRVFMRHISGYPGRYNARAKTAIQKINPAIVVVGHSHICKIVRGKNPPHIHINPGAAGIHGFHKVRTLVLAELKSGKITDLKVVELGKRGAL